jgi:hypothetical protein
MQTRFLPLIPALAASTATTADNIEVFVSPKGGATDAIVRELGKAKAEVNPETTSVTPGSLSKSASMHQKQPPAKIALSARALPATPSERARRIRMSRFCIMTSC